MELGMILSGERRGSELGRIMSGGAGDRWAELKKPCRNHFWRRSRLAGQQAKQGQGGGSGQAPATWTDANLPRVKT